MDFNEIRHQATQLVSRYGARDVMLEDLRRMFHMEWQEAPKADWVKPTMSPDAYNACIGAIRLLTATEPQISVPFDESDDEAKTHSEEMEKAAKAMLAGSKRVTQRPPHYEVVFSATLFGEVCLAVSKTADLLEMARETKIKGTIARMEAISKRTPYLFQVYNPEVCYPDFDALGLRGLLRRVETTWGEVLDTWGQAAEDLGPNRKRQDKVKLNDWYDWDTHAVWLDQASEPIYLKDNELGFLPVVAQIAEGSFLFPEPERQRLPLLYALYKSGLWYRQNLSLTVLFSLVYALGSVPLWKRKTLEPGKPFIVNREGPIGTIDLGPDEDIGMFAEKVIDPSVMTALQVAQQLGTESTMSKVSLGQPLQGGQLTFSTLSLLASSGRLPLVSPKQVSGEALARGLEIALQWLKADGKREKVYLRGSAVTIDPANIPDVVNFEVNLEPDLPQDKLQQANAGNMISGSGLASKRWVRENILNIGQSSAMEKEVWTERRLQVELEMAIQKVQAEAAKKLQQMMQPPTQPPPAGAGGGVSAPPGGAMSADMMGAPPGEGATPEEAAALGESMGPNGERPPGGVVGPGAPLQRPLPPRWQQG